MPCKHFYIDYIAHLRLYKQPFSTPSRCDNRHTTELRKKPVLGGRRERLQRGPRRPAAVHPFPQGSIREARRPEPKEPGVQTLSDDSPRDRPLVFPDAGRDPFAP